MATRDDGQLAASITSIYRYPVKGLSPQALRQVRLAAGETIPFDRIYAIENGPGPFDPDRPEHLPKIHFCTLMRHEQLAKLKTEFDTATHTLSLWHNGALAARGDLRVSQGRHAIANFIAGYMAQALRGTPRVVSAAGHSFSDIAPKCLHIVNMRSVAALETLLGAGINPLRFRPNLILDGLPEWAEFDLIGKTFQAGSATFEVFKRTERCTATNVDPVTGARDMKIPSFLSRTLGHADFGVYARVVDGGHIAIGDQVTL